MNAHTWLDSTNIVTVLPSQVPLGKTSHPAKRIRTPELRILPSFKSSESLYELVVRTQQGIESAELMVFAALGGAGLAGIVASFCF